MSEWLPRETNTHQDHVIAHAVGATVLGHFVADDALHLALDIGFVWTIYLDGEMGLSPDALTVSELEADDDVKAELVAEIHALHEGASGGREFSRVTRVGVECLIEEVEFYATEDGRRVLLRGEAASLLVETSLARRDFSVTEAA